MINKRNDSYKLLISSILCSSLVACGGGSSNEKGGVLNGITINESNYQSVMETGVIGGLRAVTQLIDSGDEVDIDQLSLLDLTGSSATFRCDNSVGRLTATLLDENTQRLNFENCYITNVEPSSSYDGIAVINMADNLETQNIALINYTQTSLIDGGDSNTSNGNITVYSSYNASTLLNRDTLTSSGLIIDSTSGATGVTTTYDFSDLYFDIKGNTSDGTSEYDLSFTADITNIGDLQLTTDPLLTYDASGLLLSGKVIATTGRSSAKMEATGSDNIEISLDSANDGDYEVSIPTTWSTIYQ